MYAQLKTVLISSHDVGNDEWMRGMKLRIEPVMYMI